MKIKIFCSRHIRALEVAVNKFIKDKYVIGIYQSKTGGRAQYLTITILYDDTFDGGYVKTKLDEEIKQRINKMNN